MRKTITVVLMLMMSFVVVHASEYLWISKIGETFVSYGFWNTETETATFGEALGFASEARRDEFVDLVYKTNSYVDDVIVVENRVATLGEVVAYIPDDVNVQFGHESIENTIHYLELAQKNYRIENILPMERIGVATGVATGTSIK